MLQNPQVKEGVTLYQDYDGPLYTPTIIAGILRAYGLPSLPELKSPRDETGAASLTAYPPQNIRENVLLQDILLDWQIRKGVLENRCVAFLFNMPPNLEGHPQIACDF